MLEAWAINHTACSGPAESALDEYKHCPDGSKPWEQINEEDLEAEQSLFN